MKRVRSRFSLGVTDGDINLIQSSTQSTSFAVAEERADAVLSKLRAEATPQVPTRALRSEISPPVNSNAFSTSDTPYESLRTITTLGPRHSHTRNSLRTPKQVMPSSNRKKGAKSVYTPSGRSINGAGLPPTPHTARALLRKATGVQAAPQRSAKKVLGTTGVTTRRRETPRNNLRRLASVLASVEAFDPIPPAATRGQSQDVHTRDDMTPPVLSANIDWMAAEEDEYIEPPQSSTLAEPHLNTASEQVALKVDGVVSQITSLQKDRTSEVVQSTTRSPLQERPLTINNLPSAVEIGLRNDSMISPLPIDTEIFHGYADNDDLQIHSPLDETQDLSTELRSARPSLGGIMTEGTAADEIADPDDELKSYNANSEAGNISIRDISQEPPMTMLQHAPHIPKPSANWVTDHRITKHPSIPRSLIRSLALTFSRSKTISKDTLDAVAEAGDTFLKQAADDLATYAKHARRKQRITEDDVFALMNRQRLLGPKTTVFSLANQYLPRELSSRIAMPPPPLQSRRS